MSHVMLHCILLSSRLVSYYVMLSLPWFLVSTTFNGFWCTTCIKLSETYRHVCIRGLCLPYFLEFFPPLNCSRTAYLAWAEWNKPRPWIVPAPCACAIRCGSTFNCSIARVVPKRATKLVEIVVCVCTRVRVCLCACVRVCVFWQLLQCGHRE